MERKIRNYMLCGRTNEENIVGYSVGLFKWEEVKTRNRKYNNINKNHQE